MIRINWKHNKSKCVQSKYSIFHYEFMLADAGGTNANIKYSVVHKHLQGVDDFIQQMFWLVFFNGGMTVELKVLHYTGNVL